MLTKAVGGVDILSFVKLGQRFHCDSTHPPRFGSFTGQQRAFFDAKKCQLT